MIRTLKPRSSRVKRVLEKREPKVVENVKKAIFVRSSTSNEVVTTLLKDLYALKKPDAVLFSRKNQVIPFEDATSLEFFSKKNDCALFCLGSNSKKRPNNMVIGRFFDHQLMEMVELGVKAYKPIEFFEGRKIGLGAKHAFIFSGQAFEQRADLQLVKSLLLDMYRGHEVSELDLTAFDNVICVTADDEGKRIYMRVYRLVLKKSGTRLPRVELDEVGPSVDFELRRVKEASASMLKEAMRVNRTLKPKKVKNVTKDSAGTYGRVHMQRQDYSKLQVRKLKGLKKRAAPEADDDGDDAPAPVVEKSGNRVSKKSKRARVDEDSD